MEYRLAILDLLGGAEGDDIVKTFREEDEEFAKAELWKLRKARYIKEHPGRPYFEYDRMKHDNGYNLIKVKYTVIA